MRLETLSKPISKQKSITKKKTKTYTVGSLFAGAGGLDLGFRGDFIFLGKKYKKNNFTLCFANDIDKNACLTFQQNFKHNIHCQNIQDFLLYTDNIRNVDVILGGFPCQDFSHAGKRQGINSERGQLYKSMIKVISLANPMLFVAENVKGLLTINNGETIKHIISEFSDLGYHITYKLFNTADFGVPQKRERVIIIGTKRDILPKFVFSEYTPCKYVTTKEVLFDLEFKEEGSVPNHFWSKAKKNKGQGNNAILEYDLAPTMRAEHHGNIEFHWNETRRLSAREVARIQSFPDDFIFYPSTSSAYKQIGNAVPPVFAWHLAQMIQNFLDEYSA